MSVIRPRLPDDALVHEVVGWDGHPWSLTDRDDTANAIRNALVADLGGLDLPRRLLEEYGSRRPSSRLFAILGEARRIRESVDRLVIVSGGSIPSATRLLVASCCHPFHNSLPRGERGGRPRLTWLDADADSDRVHGLLDLVAPEGRPRSSDLLDQWAVLAVDAPAAEEDALVARTTRLVEALAEAAGDDPCMVAERLVTVSQPASVLSAFAASRGSTDRFRDEIGIVMPQGVFTAAALLPAAIAGIDVVRLLEGADAMLTRFVEAPAAMNPVLVDAAYRHGAGRDYGVVGNLFTGGGSTASELSSWARHVRPVSSFSPSLRESQGAGISGPAIVTHVSIDEPRRKGVPLLPGGMPSPQALITIRLPRLDEHALGQLLQLVILSAAMEKRFHETV